MSSLAQDEYRRGWCARYLREAKADLRIAEEAEGASLAIEMCLVAARKAQTALYYALGDPAWMEPLVKAQAEERSLPGADPVLLTLISLERALRGLSFRATYMEKSMALSKAKAIIEASERLIDVYT